MSQPQPQPQVTTFATSATFMWVADKFKATLSDKEKNEFGTTTFHDLNVAIDKIQKKQASEKRLQGMRRLGAFLEGMKEYDKLISVFLNSTPVLAFVWGPMKLLLQMASTFHEAFDTLLDAYKRIGEHIPLLVQYDGFRNSTHMCRLLSLLYEDILEFHWKAMRYFKQKAWKQLFHALWKNFQTEFEAILKNMDEHRHLIESQAAVTQLVEVVRTQEIARAAFESQNEIDTRRRRDFVYHWLSATNCEIDQEAHSIIRQEYPGTGQWLFRNNQFDSWFDPQYCATHLLWLTGIPGAGKTILAAITIEEARKLQGVHVVFFYSRYQDAERNTFIAIARGILQQLFHQDDALLPYLFDKATTSGQTTLSTDSLAEELLKTCIQNSQKLYVILDGIDECLKKERKHIVSVFQKIWKSLPSNDVDSLRCMFVSQDDKPARGDFENMVSLKVSESDNKSDIRSYATARSASIQAKFDLSTNERQDIEDLIVNRSEGMFLFAKLTCSYLYDQTTLESLRAETSPERFPQGYSRLDLVYSRIVKRLTDGGPMSAESIKLLAWLVCAKRQLKWQEIQCAVSIDIDEQIVDWEQKRFRVDSKELCSSLIEIHADNTVKLVHHTARRYLVRQSFIDVGATELTFAKLCIGYLSFPSFDADICPNTFELFITLGYYGFFDYAYAYWSRHLAASLLPQTSKDALEELSEVVGVFIDMHWIGPQTVKTPTKGLSERWKHLEDNRNFDKIVLAGNLGIKQLVAITQQDTDDPVLRLRDILAKVREILEGIPSNLKTRKFVHMYGSQLYKCPRVNCTHFYNGFASKQERDDHVSKHERSFLCSFPGCVMGTLGCATLKELQKHTQSHGSIPLDEDEPEFPELPPEKVSYKCTQCDAKFTRNENLKNHMRSSHSITKEKRFFCSTCGKSFVRRGDCTRHESTTHSGARTFTCGGVLQDGSPWGCGYECNRGDLLNRHWKSKKGQACVLPKQQEEAAESTLSPGSVQ